MDNINELIKELLKKKCITFNNNNLNYDFKNIISFPYIINIIIKLFYEKIKYLEFNNIIGINNLSINISNIISYNYNIPLLMFTNSILKNIDGIFNDYCNVIIVTDIINSGKSVLNYINLLNKNKINVTNIFCIIDLDVKKNENLKKYNIFSLFDLQNIIDVLNSNNVIKINNVFNIENNNKYNLENRIKLTSNNFLINLFKIINHKQTNICLNCDIISIKDIVKIIEIIGKDICLLEINSNNILNFNDEYAIALKKLAISYKFLIFDNTNIINSNSKIYFDLNSLSSINCLSILKKFSDSNFILYNNDISEKEAYNLIKSNKKNIIGTYSNNLSLHDNSIIYLNKDNITFENDINKILSDNSDIYRINASLILDNPGDFIRVYKKKLWIFKNI